MKLRFLMVTVLVVSGTIGVVVAFDHSPKTAVKIQMPAGDSAKAAVVLAPTTTVAPAAPAIQTPSGAAGSSQYWTPARMQEAKPIGTPISPTAAAEAASSGTSPAPPPEGPTVSASGHLPTVTLPATPTTTTTVQVPSGAAGTS